MTRREGGFTLVELVVASAILLVVTAALLQMAVLTQRLVQAQGDLAELNQRARVAGALLYQELLAAGAGPWHGEHRGSLAARVPAVRPARTGALNPDPELTFADDRLSLLYVPDTRSQTTLTADMAFPGAPLVIDAAAPGCPAGGACGFEAGDRAIVLGHGPGSYDVFTIGVSGAGLLTPSKALSASYPAGSAVAAVRERVYYLDHAKKRLMMYDGALTDSVVLDHVVDMRFTYFGTVVNQPTQWEELPEAVLTDGPLLGAPPHRFDADLLRVRRIRVVLTLEPHAGWIPWLWQGVRHVTLDVTPRNMGITP